MTIGTVPPNPDINCVRNVTFKNIDFHYPLKAIYVKTNPGQGKGIIENILYEDIKIKDPVWWNIYIGPQQQKQPDGGGPGCMLYPIIKDCATQPLVDVRNITLRNVHTKGGLLPGIIRCNASNPCTGIVFDNVTHEAAVTKIFKWGYIVENVYGQQINAFPNPGFKSENPSFLF